MNEAERRGYQVLWVDPIVLRSARLQRKDVAKLARRLRQFRRPFVQVSDRIWRLAPFGIPLQGTRLGAALNRRLLAFQIRRSLRRLGAQRVLLWSYSPYLVRLRQSIDCEIAIYYRTDDYLSAPGVNVSRLRKQEYEAAALADLCVTVNELSLAERPSSTRRRLLVRNGVDLTVFDVAAAAQSDDPIPQVAHPRLLVIGTYDRWFDLDLLRTLMSERRDWSLLLAGESKVDLGALTALPNVSFIGHVQLERLPALIAACDIGLVPHRVEPLTTKMSPGKVYQYLAMGLPVLCTPFIDPSVFADQIAVAPGEPAAFGQAIESLLSADSRELTAARRAFAAEQSWAVRFDAIEGEIAGVLMGEEPGDARPLQSERAGPGLGSAEHDPAQAGEKA